MRAKLAGVLLAASMVAWAVPAPAQEGGPAAISDIRQETTERSTRLTVECTAPLTYTYYSPDPLTLVVDIPEVDASRVPSKIEVGTREVESIRVTGMARADGRSLARLEVRLANLAPYQIYAKDRTLNLIFERPGEVASASPAAEPALPAPAPPPASDEAAALPVPETEAPPRPAEAPRAVPPPPAAAAAPPTSGPRAGKILGVTQQEDGDQLAFVVRADGRLKYQDFFLGNPDRLVLDFPDVVSRSLVRTLEVNRQPVRRVRLAQFSAASPKIARLVLDLSERAPYRIVEGRDGLKIAFGEGQAPSPAPLAALRPALEPAPEPVAVAAAGPAPAPLPAPVLPEPIVPEPQLPERTFDAKTLGPEEKKYTGHPISLDFRDGDLQDIFRLFADISGLNVVVNPGVTGKVTLKLNEVPWDQALELILKTHNLGYTLEDNVIRIAKLQDLQREEQERRKLQEEKALAGELQVMRRSLSYAKAAELEPTLRKVALSQRGSITLDARTNTMIVQDLPLYLDKARDLINELDRATPQVEIEARIVLTTRTFVRDLGIQWGFSQIQLPQLGNTTNLTFPNSIVINGSPALGGGILPATPTNNEDQSVGPPRLGYAVNLPAAAFNSGIGVSVGNILGNLAIDAALTALENQGRGRLLSSPKVTTQDNTTAEIEQGVKIPFAIQTVSQTGIPTTTIQFEKAVLNLKVTPQITEANTVILGLELKNDSVDFATVVEGRPAFRLQMAKTTVLVQDGQTAVVGGVFQTREQTNRRSTPFLGDLPILGYLFRGRRIDNENQELLLFLTPRIVKS